VALFFETSSCKRNGDRRFRQRWRPGRHRCGQQRRTILLRNNVGAKHHSLGVRLVGKRAKIDAIGARITYQSGDLRRSHLKVGGGSYLSSHHPRIVLGIGPRSKFDCVEVHWPQPSSLVQRFTTLPIDCYITIVEGQERMTAAPK
jgi:enediyne biosynthesis protein E4